MNGDRTLKKVGRIFLFVGLVMAGGGAWWWQSVDNFVARAHSAPGEVLELIEKRDSDGSSTYAPRVSFQLDGGRTVIFTSTASSNPPSFHEGEQVRVLYDPDEPQEAKIDTFFQLYGGPIIIGGIGTVFFVIGAALLLSARMTQRTNESLKQNGRRVVAQLEGVQRDTSVTVNGVHPWRIRAQWEDPQTRKLHVFTSNNLWFDPQKYLQDQITVYVDPKNPQKHWMDTSFLPELAA